MASVSVSESRVDSCRTVNGSPWDAAPYNVHPSARSPEAADSPLRGDKEVVQLCNPVSDPSGRISARRCRNPPNAWIERLAAGRSVVVGRTRPLRFVFLCHADAPSSGSIGWKQREDAGRKLEIRVIDLRRRNACRRRSISALPAWRAPAGPVPAGQGRKPAEPGARTARALRGWRRSGPMATSRYRCWGHS